MKIKNKQNVIAVALAYALAFTNAYAQTPPSGGPPTPGFNNKTPSRS